MLVPCLLFYRLKQIDNDQIVCLHDNRNHEALARSLWVKDLDKTQLLIERNGLSQYRQPSPI